MAGTQRAGATELRNKALSGLIKMQIVLALLIFIPAGTLRFWQGWLFWVVFLALVLWITLYFLKHDPHLIAGRMEAGPIAEQQTSQKMIQAIAGLLAFALVIVPGLDYRFHGSSVPAPIVLMADALMVLGFGHRLSGVQREQLCGQHDQSRYRATRDSDRALSIRAPSNVRGCRAGNPGDAIGARIDLGSANRRRTQRCDSRSPSQRRTLPGGELARL